jgi:hypothetical protein
MSGTSPAPQEQSRVPQTSEVTPEEARAMLRAALSMFDRWQLTATESRRLLGSPAERTYQRWRKDVVAALSADTIFRLGVLIGIHKALRYTFTSPERGYAWVRKSNAAFGGRSALDKMLQGAPTDLAEVRAYLDAERGGW